MVGLNALTDGEQKTTTYLPFPPFTPIPLPPYKVHPPHCFTQTLFPLLLFVLSRSLSPPLRKNVFMLLLSTSSLHFCLRCLFFPHQIRDFPPILFVGTFPSDFLLILFNIFLSPLSSVVGSPLFHPVNTEPINEMTQNGSAPPLQAEIGP